MGPGLPPEKGEVRPQNLTSNSVPAASRTFGRAKTQQSVPSERSMENEGRLELEPNWLSGAGMVLARHAEFSSTIGGSAKSIASRDSVFGGRLRSQLREAKLRAILVGVSSRWAKSSPTSVRHNWSSTATARALLAPFAFPLDVRAPKPPHGRRRRCRSGSPRARPSGAERVDLVVDRRDLLSQD